MERHHGGEAALLHSGVRDGVWVTWPLRAEGRREWSVELSGRRDRVEKQ